MAPKKDEKKRSAAKNATPALNPVRLSRTPPENGKKASGDMGISVDIPPLSTPKQSRAGVDANGMPLQESPGINSPTAAGTHGIRGKIFSFAPSDSRARTPSSSTSTSDSGALSTPPGGAGGSNINSPKASFGTEGSSSENSSRNSSTGAAHYEGRSGSPPGQLTSVQSDRTSLQLSEQQPAKNQATLDALASIVAQTGADGVQPKRDQPAPSRQSLTQTQTHRKTGTTKAPFLSALCNCFGSRPPRDSEAPKNTQMAHMKASRGSGSSRGNRAANFDSPNRTDPNGYPVPRNRGVRPQVVPVVPAPSKANMSRKCLALDLDETLVHSSFQYVSQADYRIPVKIDGQVHDVFVIKRPGVDEFLTRMAAKYEIFIFTASLSKYANPLLDRLDTSRVISHRLFRENCVFSQGSFVKDLSFIGRPLDQTIIVDNSAQSFIFHPENAIGCSSFIDDPSDVELWQIADFLDSIADVEDVRYHCPDWRSWCARNKKRSSVPRKKSR